MFTGLVQTVGTIREVAGTASGRRLSIDGELSAADLQIGASVSVAGVCLTVTASRPRGFVVEAAFATLAVTRVGSLVAGDRVNLEPALRVGDPLGGHLVSGHVDGIGRVRRRAPRGEAVHLSVDAPGALLPLIAVKGSICVDGVSLTVNEVDDRGFAVGLVPHTLAVTTLGAVRAGRELHLEVDLIARHVARLAAFARPGLQPATLAAAGFPVDDHEAS